MIKMIYRRLILIGVLFLLCNQINAQYIPDSTTVPKHALGINWNLGNLVHNYPSLQLGLLYSYDKQWLFELGAGRVTDSEIFQILDDHKEHLGGYRIHAEARYLYQFISQSGSGIYVGIGFAHLESRFQTAYVIKKQIQDDFYYQNIDREYKTIINQGYVKIGYMLMTPSQRVFFDFGLNFGYSDKKMSPEIDRSGTILSNRGFTENIYKSPQTLLVDVKIGVLLFK